MVSSLLGKNLTRVLQFGMHSVFGPYHTRKMESHQLGESAEAGREVDSGSDGSSGVRPFFDSTRRFP